MTPPASIAGRGATTTLPRRRSGATRPDRRRPETAPRVTAPPHTPRRTREPRAARAPLPARVARGVLDAPILDRLVRGSGWIPVIAVGLMGIVFMQVSMLKLNSGIGRAVESAATLERQNSELRGEVSALGSNERIEGVARKAGMVVPAAGSFRYVTARPGRTDAREAARGIVPPQPVQPGSKVAEQQPAAAAAAATQQPAAATQQPAAATQQPAAATQQPAAATQQPAAATQQPAAATQQPAAAGVQQQEPAHQHPPAVPAGTATETPAG